MTSDPRTCLTLLATSLRQEETPISAHVVDPGEDATLGERVATGPRAVVGPAEYALAVEAIREGYLLHYSESRLLSGHDADLGLLAGDYLYALGLDRLAKLDAVDAVAVLADLISRCAQLHTEGRESEVPALWDSAVNEIAEGPRPET